VVAILILAAAAVTQGQTSLDRDATLEILEKLTSQNRTTWIPAGTLEAGHQEYRAAQTTDEAQIASAIDREVQDYQSRADKVERTAQLQEMRLEAIPFNVRYELANEYTMNSHVVVKYDGERFYWSIDVASRSDSVKLPAELTGNYMVDRFNLDWNGRRAYTWDGQEYTIYSRSANHATVDAANRFPRAVNGPLTAGVIPWGSGALTYGKLSEAKITASEVYLDGNTLIEMAIELSNGSSLSVLLDPAKDYAATFCTAVSLGGKATSKFYSGYRQIAGNWVPSTVLIEQRDAPTDRLLRSDKWDFTVVSDAVPGPEQFEVEYQADTVVEYYGPDGGQPAIYRHSNATDTKLLLAERLSYAATKSRQPQNCATAAVQRTAAQLGKSVPASALAELVDADGQTTMDDIKRFVQGLGLYCRAVKTSVSVLRDLPACQAILHIPGQNHFVVVDHIDEQDAWIVDLSKPTFYYRQDVGSLPIDRSGGMALLVSDRPISGPLDDVSDIQLATRAGGDGWSCTLLLQESSVTRCQTDGYTCWGVIRVYAERWGCETAPSGSCFEIRLGRYIYDDCFMKPDLSGCTCDASWEIVYMDACD